MKTDPREYFMENCYALRGCLHCPDCIAFALKFYRLAVLSGGDKAPDQQKMRILAIKFIVSTIASENLPCDNALTAENLKMYIDGVLSGTVELPNCHYEFK